MKNGFSEREHKILYFLSKLPRNILSVMGNDNVPEFVLYSLADKQGFDFTRVAYFVDNPDFDWVKGVAGVAQAEAYEKNGHDIWTDPNDFSEYMKKAPFNQKVRAISSASFRRKGATDKDIAESVADTLGLDRFRFCSWDMKYDNHGLLVYEPKSIDNVDESKESELIGDAASLLSFCPVF